MKKILFLSMLGLLSLTVLAHYAHPFYVSICQINYNAEAKSLEIACKIFIDDLEEALEQKGNKDLNLGLENESASADEYISAYLSKHLSIEVNALPVQGDFLGKEITDDVVWCYIEMLEVPFPNEISIHNTLLLSTFENQQNIVHMKVNGKEKSLRLFQGREKESLNF